MIFKGTFLNIIDNSGGLTAQCIEIYKRSSIRGARVGDVILVVIKSAQSHKKIKKGRIMKALIVHSKSFLNLNNGFLVKFRYNNIILLDNKLNPIGSRLKGPIVSELLKRIFFKKIIALVNIIF